MPLVYHAEMSCSAAPGLVFFQALIADGSLAYHFLGVASIATPWQWHRALMPGEML